MAETKKTLWLKNGKKYGVTGESGRYWLCKGTQFRKGSPEITKITEKPVKAKKEEV